MSVYSASAPVTHSTTDPSASAEAVPWVMKNCTAYQGLSAYSTPGAWMMFHTPITPRLRNHSTMIGPNTAPTLAVPWRCIQNRPSSTATVSGTTQCDSAGAATSRPSTADSTEIDGVITPSPKNSAAPSKAISTTSLRMRVDWPTARWASVISAMMPPSPLLSARITRLTYFTATTRISDQVTSERIPSTVAGRGCRPCSGRKVSCMVYSGLVPMSPNTTPIAPRISAERLPCEASAPPVSVEDEAWVCWFMTLPTALAAERGAQCLADDGLGAVAVGGDLLHQARDFGRLVAELLQRDRRFAGSIQRRGCAGRHAGQAYAKPVHAVAQLHHDALGSLLADTGNLGQRHHVAGVYQPREVAGGHARQYRQRDLRADAADLEQVAEQCALGFAHETVQRHAVFLHGVVSEQDHFLAGGGEIVDGRHRRLELVADAAHIDQQPWRLLRNEGATQATDHRPRLHAVRGIPTRARLERVCAWVTAIASASAASACSGPFRPSSTPIMCCTWVLSPRPLPTTDCFTSVAAYSCTTIP